MGRLKKLTEQRAALQAQMKKILEKAETEERAMTEEEIAEFERLDTNMKNIEKTIEAEERASSAGLINSSGDDEGEELTDEERAEAEQDEFANYIRGVVAENRADVNLSTGANGAVIPTSIANKIITKVKEISPIFQLSDVYNISGNLQIPYYDEETTQITMKYATEFTDLESTSGKLESIDLKGFLAGALTKVPRSLINKSAFDIVSFVVDRMAEAAAAWVEGEALNGTTNKIDGLAGGVTQIVTAAATATFTADELIDLQEEVPDRYQKNCIWIMSKAARKIARKLKDSDGQYLLQKDATARWGYKIFGADVYVSDNMPVPAAGKTSIYYGDMKGLAVKVGEELEIQVLREKFATQHAVGVVGWMDVDAKVQDAQRIAALKMKASA